MIRAEVVVEPTFNDATFEFQKLNSRALVGTRLHVMDATGKRVRALVVAVRQSYVVPYYHHSTSIAYHFVASWALLLIRPRIMKTHETHDNVMLRRT